MAEVFVAGSINRDFVLKLQRRPQPGETVTNAELSFHNGGKGANQASAVALLGGDVTFLGCVGDDEIGEPLVRALQDHGVDTSLMRPVPETSTGAAFITLTPDGENSIIVAPGANRRLSTGDVDAAASSIREAKVLVAQMEIPVEVVERASEIASDGGTRVVLNLAPPREVSERLLQRPDPLVVNEHEAAFLLGEEIEGVENAADAARKLLSLGPRSAVVTLGATGAVVADGDSTSHVPAPEAEVVDSTGAGDAFVGALALRLARGEALARAVGYAVRAATVAVTRVGAQSALPTSEDVEAL